MRNFIIGFLLFVAFSSFAQQNDEKLFFHDISIDYGLFASLNSDAHQNLVGNKISIQTAYFYTSHFGIRSGISFINDLESTNKFYSVPIQFIYRTPVDKSFFIGGTIDSIEDLIFKIILGLIPRQTDFHFGANLGYIEPDNNLGLSSINGGPFVQRGFQTEQRFVATVDLGLRLHYKIRRFGIVAAPNVSYLVSENFKYYSDIGVDYGYEPKWFMNISIGLAYQF
ncbi:MAG: hypothetical protein K8R31_04685 [Bacteroidales bacterium]|nr:hypothetical protein [Bacteroidales bacterium]